MKPIHTEDLPLFAPTPTQVGLAKRDATASKNARNIERLIPLTLELAAKAGEPGITVADIRVAAVQRGLLTGAETGRTLSWLGALPQAAGLVRTGVYRRSFLARSNGTLQMAWRAPERATSRDNVA